jgi:hypothetical protein
MHPSTNVSVEGMRDLRLKRRVISVHAIKAYRGRRGIAPLRGGSSIRASALPEILRKIELNI